MVCMVLLMVVHEYGHPHHHHHPPRYLRHYLAMIRNTIVVYWLVMPPLAVLLMYTHLFFGVSVYIGVKTEEGVAMASLIGAVDFVELSALTQNGLGDMFKSAANAALQYRLKTTGKKKSNKKCAVQ
jgi:hypothetical protein